MASAALVRRWVLVLWELSPSTRHRMHAIITAARADTALVQLMMTTTLIVTATTTVAVAAAAAAALSLTRMPGT
jgi:hypothetical protein